MNLVNVTINSTYGWISFSNQSISLIAPNNYTYVNAYLGPLPVGTYLGTIFINSSNDGSETIPVAFQVSSGGGQQGGGGAGGGGSILFKGINITLNYLTTYSYGGTGNVVTGQGGAGGTGRIHVDYVNSATGTTDPVMDTRFDPTLMPPSGILML